MSVEIRVAAIDVLTPLVGKAMATIYVAQAVMSRHKTSDRLDLADLGGLCDEIRRVMQPFASEEVLDEAIAEIFSRVHS